jgi:hypothetical protein
LLSSRSALLNSRHRRHRMRRRPQLHQRNNRRVFPHNPAHRCNRAPLLNNRPPVCRQAHRECHRPVRLAPVLQDQLFRERLLLQH